MNAPPPWSIYRSAWLYRAVVIAMYRGGADARDKLILDRIQPGESVLELCFGDSRLGARVVQRGARWRGIDGSPAFVKRALARGLDCRQANVHACDWGTADVVVLVASLYQFTAVAEDFLARMQRTARRAVIVSEPISHLTPAGAGLRHWLGSAVVDAGFGANHLRIDERGLRALYTARGAIEQVITARGREILAVLPGEAGESTKTSAPQTPYPSGGA